MFIILRNTPNDKGVPINHNIALSQPHLTSFKMVASRWFIEGKDRINDLNNTFYEETCNLKRATIMNYQKFLRMAQFFNDGYTAIKTGSVARVIHCKAEEVEVNLQHKQEGCWDQLPVFRLNEEGKPYNQTFFPDPITKVLSPTGPRVDCSARYPQMY